MYDVGLSWAQLENYLPGLVRSGLLEITEDHGKRLYRITKKGWIFPDAYSVLISLLDLQNQVGTRARSWSNDQSRVLLPHGDNVFFGGNKVFSAAIIATSTATLTPSENLLKAIFIKSG
jgi:hypothetical protein